MAYLWVGTNKGLNKININTGEIKNYLPGENGCKLSNCNITEILVDSKGDVYISTVDGINRYNKEKDNFDRLYYSQEDNKNSLSSEFIYTLSEDIYGNMWAGTKNGLNMIDKEGKITQLYYDKNISNSISNNIIYKLYSDNYGYLWIGTSGGGLNRLNIKTGEVKRFLNDPNNSKSIPGNNVNYIIEDTSGMLWIATDSGLCKYDKEEDEFITYKSKVYDNTGLINNDVLSLYQDRTGMIWVGTYKGISLFNPGNTFVNYRNNPFDSNSISGNSMAGIYEDKDKLLWVGTTHNGVNVIDRQKNHVVRIGYQENNENSISNNSIKDIEGIENEIWIATYDGLNKYDKLTKKITRYYANGSGLPSNDIKSLFIDDEGILWISTNEGIITFDRKDKFVDYTNLLKDGGISEMTFSDIYQDKDGIMWLASAVDGGLVKFNKETGEIRNYKHQSDNEYSISSSSIKAIAEDSSGNLWIATHYGINKLNKETEKFYRYTEKDGLANNFTYGIVIDEEDNPWISTNYGISKFDIKENKFINFDVTDGIQGNEFNGYSFYKNSNGDMFFGGIDGLTVFNPKDIKKDVYIPRVNIESVLSNGKKINVKSDINLSYKNNQFEVNFFMPDYRNTLKIQYAYKLEGFDEEWILSGDRNYANYTNLEPGDYKFKVTGRNARGEWSDIQEFNIKIRKPLWRTPTAYILYLILIIVLIYLIWNRVKILDAMVKQRTYELDKNLMEKEEIYAKLIRNERYKNNYFVNLSHELRTPLNVILSIQQLITKLNKEDKQIPKDKIDYYMDTLKRNSDRLLNLINNIIDTSKIESGSYKLKFEEVDIVYLVEESVLSMKDYIESNGIELIIDPEIEEKVIKCDKCEIEKCVINLVANSIKFTPKGGSIEVKIIDLKSKVKISVKDTGIGIDKKYHKAIFNRFGQAYNEVSEEHGGSGLGLTLTNQLVELHGGKITLESDIGKGSIFSIILPVDQYGEEN